MNRAFAAVLALIVGCHPAVAPPPLAVPARPRLVVLLVIDQLPVYAFERDRSLFRGGFARLLRDGAYAIGELPHANPFTAPGHATIGTGTTPNIHGIVGNQWYRRAEGKEQLAEYDPDAPMFSVTKPGTTIDAFASARALRVDGLADVLRRETQGRGHSVAVALKSRAATLIAGRKPDLAIWFEAAAGGMTTSTAYAPAIPAWLADLDRARPAQRFLGTEWKPLDAALLAKHTGIADDSPGEGDVHGLGITFPHPIKELEAIVMTPFGDELVVDAASAAIDALHLGEDDVADLLALSLNCHDYAGHTWGADSWEILEVLLRDDAMLGDLFAKLDRKLGKDGWSIVMTSDHGATPMPEHSTIPGVRRIPPDEIAAAVNDLASSVLGGAGPWVAKVSSSQVYMTDAFEAEELTFRNRILHLAAQAVRENVPGIEQVYPSAPLLGTPCKFQHGLERAVCYALVPGEAGDLFVVPARGFLITEHKAGTHHDAPNDDNRKVPMIVVAPGLARQTGTGSQLQIAPTVAALLGISAPPAATEKPLFGLAARPPAQH